MTIECLDGKRIAVGLICGVLKYFLYIWLYAVSVEETFRKANDLHVPYCEGDITSEGWEFGCFSSVVLNPNLYGMQQAR